MRRLLPFRILILGILLAMSAMTSQDVGAPPRPVPPSVSLGSFPLDFIPNQGQVAPEARFYARTPGYALWVTREGLVFDSSRRSSIPGERDVTSLAFIGGAADPEIVPVEPTAHVVNVLAGNDPSRWRTGIETSRAVLYRDLYRGIDLKVYGVEKEIEYDWVVKPGADAGRIRFACAGHRSVRIDARGNLAVETAFGDIVHRNPTAYQIVDGRRKEVAARFREREAGVYGFEIGAYDGRAELVIDPAVLVSSTYLGGRADDHFESLAVDGSGAIYVAGSTESANFPMKKALDVTLSGFTDAFVAKIAPDGKSLAFSTFLGGNSTDGVADIALDRNGDLVVCGATRSSNFPTLKAYDSTLNGGSDGFIARLDGAAGTLAYSTYIGGSKDDDASAITPNADGTLVVSGGSQSSNFPVKNAYDPTANGERDVVLLKLSKDGKSLVFSTYFGGTGDDWIEAHDVDAKGYIYVAGSTYSSSLPVKNAFQPVYRGNGDVFLAKFAPSGGSLVYSTFFGGPALDDVGGIRVNAKGSAVLTGGTSSDIFPLKNALDTTRNGVEDIFVSQFAPSGKSLVFSTYLGGSGSDWGDKAEIDGSGNIWITGDTSSKNFPVQDAYNKGLSGDYDVIVARLSPAGKALTFGTYLGGSGKDLGKGIAPGKNGEVILIGLTDSTNFPVKNAIDQTWNGGLDGFIAKLKVPAN